MIAAKIVRAENCLLRHPEEKRKLQRPQVSPEPKTFLPILLFSRKCSAFTGIQYTNMNFEMHVALEWGENSAKKKHSKILHIFRRFLFLFTALLTISLDTRQMQNACMGRAKCAYEWIELQTHNANGNLYRIECIPLCVQFLSRLNPFSNSARMHFIRWAIELFGWEIL